MRQVRASWVWAVMAAVLSMALLPAALVAEPAPTGQVTREEFDAVAKRVTILEAQVQTQNATLSRRITALEGQLKAAPNQPAQAAPAGGGKKLEGRDLTAWKLARQAAEAKHRDYVSQIASRTVPMPRGDGGIVYVNANDPVPVFDEGAATSDCMTKDAKGDYLFRFVERTKTNGKVERLLEVRVVDYGSELRADSVTRRNP
jgi:hypothetical protein